MIYLILWIKTNISFEDTDKSSTLWNIFHNWKYVYVCLYQLWQTVEYRKKMDTRVGRIFVWNDTFQVDNES